jgi:hypothetical protein
LSHRTAALTALVALRRARPRPVQNTVRTSPRP